MCKVVSDGTGSSHLHVYGSTCFGAVFFRGQITVQDQMDGMKMPTEKERDVCAFRSKARKNAL